MKIALTLLLCLSLLSIFPLATTAVPQQAEALPIPLTNKDILDMFTAKLGDEVIISKINSSRCHFDTVPSMLGELKHNGVSDAVIRVMIEAPYGMPKQQNVRRNPQSQENTQAEAITILGSGQELVLPEGNEFTVQTVDEISSKTASENDPVNLRVVEDVKIGNQVVIAGGTLVKGIVASVEQRGHLGKGGKIGMRVESTTAVDGQRVKLRSSKGKGDTGTVGSTIVLSLLISPLFLLRRGNHAVIKAGTKVQVFTDEEKKVQVSRKAIS
jgi:hypothetical protein